MLWSLKCHTNWSHQPGTTTNTTHYVARCSVQMHCSQTWGSNTCSALRFTGSPWTTVIVSKPELPSQGCRLFKGWSEMTLYDAMNLSEETRNTGVISPKYSPFFQPLLTMETKKHLFLSIHLFRSSVDCVHKPTAAKNKTIILCYAWTKPRSESAEVLVWSRVQQTVNLFHTQKP